MDSYSEHEFRKLFYVAVHLSIVWTYIKYHELRELF